MPAAGSHLKKERPSKNNVETIDHDSLRSMRIMQFSRKHPAKKSASSKEHKSQSVVAWGEL